MSDLSKPTKFDVAYAAIIAMRNIKMFELAAESIKPEKQKDENLIVKIRDELALMREEKSQILEGNQDVIDKIVDVYVPIVEEDSKKKEEEYNQKNSRNFEKSR